MESSEYRSGPLRGFDSGRLSHAYITANGSSTEYIAMTAVCSAQSEKPCRECKHCIKASRGIHPDIAAIDKPPASREIAVDQIRALKRDAFVVPNEADKKVYIIKNAESMNKAAQNALLRVLEEPPKHAVFVLETEHAAGLLKTVRSRCAAVNELPQKDHDSDTSAGIADSFFSALQDGPVRFAEFSFTLERMDKNELAAFVDSARETAVRMMRDTIAGTRCPLPREKLIRAEQILCRAAEMLELNVGAGYISGLLCASLL